MNNVSKKVLLVTGFITTSLLVLSTNFDNQNTGLQEPVPSTFINAKALPDVADVAQTALNSTVSITTLGSAGSGFLYDETTVVTAYHVVQTEPDSILLTFEDGRQRIGMVEVFDVASDIATVSFEEPITDIVPLTLETADNIKLGDFVVAIGSPVGLDSSISLGIISNIERNSQFQNSLQRNLVQTDASVNPGNSGGPLVNLNGNVVALIQLRPEIADSGRSIQGVALGLRSDAIKAGLEQLYKYGNIDYLRIGFFGQETNIESDVFPGVYVESIIDDSPASKSELQQGDVIKRIDSIDITSMEDILVLLWGYRNQDVMLLEVERNNTLINIEIILETIES